MKDDFGALFAFIRIIEKLKTELRHSWTSNKNRQESVAEHSWMMAVIAMAMFDSLNIEIDQLKVLKMIAIHDLAEAIVGDIPAFEKSDRRRNKFAAEEAAMIEITKYLPPKTAQEFLDIWHEMELRQTTEAKYAQCIDKSEVLLEHIIADISTWDEGDYSLGPYHKDEYFDFDPYIREFKNYVNAAFWKKMESEQTLTRIPSEHLVHRKLTSRQKE